MRFHVCVLDLVRVIRALVNRIGVGKACCYVTDLALDFHEYVALGLLNPRLGSHTRMQNWSTGLHRFLRIEYGRKNFVIDLHETTRLLGCRFSLGDDGNDALPNKAHDIVQHVCVIGIDVKVVVDSCCKKTPRDIFPRENRVHSGNR